MQRSPLSLPLLAGLLFLLPPAALAADGITSGTRDAFMTAYADAQAGRPAPADDGALVSYPLYPYLQASRLVASIRATPRGGSALPVDTQAMDFLATSGGDPVGRLVRRALLPSLAERRQWAPFMSVYAQTVTPDQALRCRSLEARIALDRTDGLADAIKAEWLTPRSTPAECDAAFDWLRARGTLGPALVEQRARLALAAGEPALAKWLAKSLPESRARPVLAWARLIEQPRSAIDALVAAPATAVEADALLDGWNRLARTDPDAARQRYAALIAARRLDATAASRYARALAVRLALNRQPEALDYFARVAPGDLDEQAAEWQVRAALRSGDWALAGSAIEAMPPGQREQPRWRYWSARAEEAGGARDVARETYAAVVPTDNWYAVLAAARLGARFSPTPLPIAADKARVDELDRFPAFVRARELRQVELENLAPAEWAAGYATLDGPGKVAAVALASRWGWYFQAIATAAQQGLFDDYRLLYPRPYDPQVAAGARLTGLPPTLIYSVMRQESLFQPRVVSPANAIGLMQLLPATARRTASVYGLPTPSSDALMEPGVNVRLGAGTLARLLERMDGQVALALAAYNAGPNAADRWRPAVGGLDLDIWVENIPYNETRNYVQKVMWHRVVYEWLAKGESQDAASWLTSIGPAKN